MRHSILAILLISSFSFVQSQDTITLVNGDQKIVKVDYETSLYVFYQKIKNEDTTQLGKRKMFEKDDVFKIEYFHNHIKGEQKVTQVYQQDSTEENYLSIDEMNRYIFGRKQAKQNYKTKKYFVSGLVVGAGSSYFGPFWGLIPCAAYTGVAGIWPIKSFYKADNKMDFYDPYFSEGYRQVALSKQAKSFGLGSITGLAISIAVLQLFLQ